MNQGDILRKAFVLLKFLNRPSKSVDLYHVCKANPCNKKLGNDLSQANVSLKISPKNLLYKLVYQENV